MFAEQFIIFGVMFERITEKVHIKWDLTPRQIHSIFEIGAVSNAFTAFLLPTAVSSLYSTGVITTLNTATTVLAAASVTCALLALINFSMIIHNKTPYLNEKHRRQELRQKASDENEPFVDKGPWTDELLSKKIDPEALYHPFWDAPWRAYGIPGVVFLSIMAQPFMVVGGEYLINFWVSNSYIASPLLMTATGTLLGANILFNITEVGVLVCNAVLKTVPGFEKL